MKTLADNPNNLSVHIRPCLPADADLLSEIGAKSFVESHGHSASSTDIDNYVAEAFSSLQVERELSDPENHFYVLIADNSLIGYSKFVLYTAANQDGRGPYCKLERIYLLKEFQGMGFGKLLLKHAVSQAKLNSQEGMWLHVWVDNVRALAFYKRYGFVVIGAYDFRISDTHVNPNHTMLKRW